MTFPLMEAGIVVFSLCLGWIFVMLTNLTKVSARTAKTEAAFRKAVKLLAQNHGEIPTTQQVIDAYATQDYEYGRILQALREEHQMLREQRIHIPEALFIPRASAGRIYSPHDAPLKPDPEEKS